MKCQLMNGERKTVIVQVVHAEEHDWFKGLVGKRFYATRESESFFHLEIPDEYESSSRKIIEKKNCYVVGGDKDLQLYQQRPRFKPFQLEGKLFQEYTRLQSTESFSFWVKEDVTEYQVSVPKGTKAMIVNQYIRAIDNLFHVLLFGESEHVSELYILSEKQIVTYFDIISDCYDCTFNDESAVYEQSRCHACKAGLFNFHRPLSITDMAWNDERRRRQGIGMTS